MKMRIMPVLLACVLMPLALSAQEQPLTPEQEEKKLREGIEKMVLNYEETLKLEVWQTFYVDSILNHNYSAMIEETKKMSQNRVENYELYQIITDKWDEKTFEAFHRIFNEEQWKKYLKTGAARAKKDRDKRAAKREGKK